MCVYIYILITYYRPIYIYIFESDTPSKQVATSKNAENARFSHTSQLKGDTEKAHFTF